jgi:hypothetical protein
MRRDDRHFALAIAAGIVAAGVILSVLSIAGMRVTYRRAYAEMAAHCRQVSLLTVDGAKYVCAPVAGVETATPSTVPDSPPSLTQL